MVPAVLALLLFDVFTTLSVPPTWKDVNCQMLPGYLTTGSSALPRQCLVQPCEHTFLAKDGQQMIEARPGTVAAASQARGMNQNTGFNAQLL